MRTPLCAVLLALALPLSAAPLRVETFTLANGLTVVLHEDHAVPLVTVNVWYKVGSRDEETGRTGFAHLFEHFMFEGSLHSPQGQYDEQINGRGGVNNATTNTDRTNYFAEVPSENLEEVLRLESDRMGFLRSSINPAALDKQRKVVKNEKRQRENAPYGQSWADLNRLVWPQGHGYSWPTIGSQADLDAATADDARRFHERFYNPNNAVLVISGDHDSARTLALVEKWFGGLAAGPADPRPVLTTPESLGGRRELNTTDDKAQLPLLMMAFPVPAAGQPGAREISVAATVLGGGATSRLYKHLQRDRRMAISISAGLAGLQQRDLLLIEATPAPGVDMAALEAAIMAEIDALKTGGLQPAELSRVKAGLATARLDALQALTGLAETLAEGQAVHGDPLSFEADIAALDAMDLAAPRDAAARWLTRDNLAVLRILPRPTPVNGGPR